MQRTWAPWIGAVSAVLLRDTGAIELIVRAPTAFVRPGMSVGGSRERVSGATLLVRVRDAASTPVTSAVVDVFWLVGGRSVVVARGISAAGGAVQIDDLRAGRYVVLASAPGLSRASTVEQLDAGASREVSLVTGPEATIVGVVRRDNGRSRDPSALEGVVVRVVPDGGGSEPAFAVRSSADGSYRIRGLRAGTFRVEVDDERFEPISRRAVPAPSRAVDLLLREFAVVRCEVRDERGAPAQGARVSIAGSGLWPARSEDAAADGVARLARVPSGVYELRAQLGGRVAEPVAPLSLEPGETRAVRMVLTDGATIEGRVVDAQTQAPIVDARVIVAEDALSAAPRALVSEHDGAFRIGGLLRRPHVISARATGYVARVADAVQAGGAPVIVGLDREVLVRGRVVDNRGAPVANAQVELASIDLDGRTAFLTATARAFREQLFERQQRGPSPLRPSGELGVTSGRVPHIPTDPTAPTAPVATSAESSAEAGFVTDSLGRFRVGEVPPGAVRVSASHPLYVRADSELRAVRAGDTIDVEVVVHVGGVIDGRLVDDRGYPIGQQLVEVRVERDYAPRRVFTARDGTFRVPAVLGRASVVAMVSGRVGARAEVEVADDQEVRVTLALESDSRRVRGRVLDRDGYPVSGAELLLAGGGHSARVLSGADGTFDALLAGRGAFAIEARHPRFASRILSGVDAREEVRISLEPGAMVIARIDARSCARADIDVALTTVCGTLHRTLRGEGEARFDQVCPGRVEFAASADGCIRSAVVAAVARSGATTELARTELLAGGSAEGELVDGRGEPVAGATITLATTAESAALSRTDRQGRFRADALPEGEQRIVAVHPVLGRSEAAAVRVLRGTVARGVRLRFERALAGAMVAGSTGWLALSSRGGAVLIDRVDEGSPGARAGLRVGDRVLSLDGVAVRDASAVERRATSGEQCVLEVERAGTRRLVRVLP